MTTHRKGESAQPWVLFFVLLLVVGLWGCGRDRASDSEEPLPIEIVVEEPVNSPSPQRPSESTKGLNPAGETLPTVGPGETPPHTP